MSSKQIAWAVVRECNEAIEAGNAIMALALVDGWRTIQRGMWVPFERGLRAVADRHEHEGAQGSDFRTYHNELTLLANYGKVEKEFMVITMEALEIRHAELMAIYEGIQ